MIFWINVNINWFAKKKLVLKIYIAVEALFLTEKIEIIEFFNITINKRNFFLQNTQYPPL